MPSTRMLAHFLRTISTTCAAILPSAMEATRYSTTLSIVWQNIVFALAVKLVILVLAALGVANMWLAVFGDVGVAIIAILNAMRAMKV